MDISEIKEIIRRELPGIMREDADMQEFIMRLARDRFADKAETESRFDRIMDELRQNRQEESRKWAEQNEKWAKNQQSIEQMLQEISHLSRKHDSTIGALGARWGLHSEAAFRNGLKAILKDFMAVEVLSINEFDHEGEVFGQPDQVELDLIIRNGVLLICEIKSSMSRSDMHAFNRKADFYEKTHQQKATRRMVISPMVDPYAQKIADRLGIEVYSYAEDIEDL